MSFRSFLTNRTLIQMANRSKIIILGAGASGIAAATRLLEKGMTDLTVLEAESRIGGRINSVKFDDTVLDLGAQWCHGEEGNVVFRMAKDLDVLSSSVNNYTDFTFYTSDGELADKAVTDGLLAVAFQVMEDKALAERTGGTFGHYFINEFKRRVSKEFPQDVCPTSELLVDWAHKIFLGIECAKSWFEVSSTGPFTYKQCEGDLYLHWRNKGYKTILDILMKKLPHPSRQLPLEDKILLNKEVNRIEWDADETVTVTCSDGSSYECDHLLVTASLGVLKKMLPCFVPKLPPSKQNAIEAMAIGNLHKIFLKFPTKWWPDDFKGFSLLWNEKDRRNLLEEFPHGPRDYGRSWLEDVYGFYVVDGHPRILLGWVVGKMIGEIEQLSDDLVMDASMFLLRKFVGKTYNVHQADGILRSKWKTNPHFDGAYSYRSLEAEKFNVWPEDLASPVANSVSKQVLLFAGEATHSEYYSTVHGAIETGFREAERILKIYQ